MLDEWTFTAPIWNRPPPLTCPLSSQGGLGRPGGLEEWRAVDSSMQLGVEVLHNNAPTAPLECAYAVEGCPNLLVQCATSGREWPVGGRIGRRSVSHRATIGRRSPPTSRGVRCKTVCAWKGHHRGIQRMERGLPYTPTTAQRAQHPQAESSLWSFGMPSASPRMNIRPSLGRDRKLLER